MITRSGARRWVAGVAVVAVAGAAATGCGGGSSKGGAGKSDPAVALAAADGPAAKAKTASLDAEVFDGSQTQKLTGGIDFSGKLRADVTMKVTASDDPKAPTQMHLIVADGTEYMSADAFLNSGPQFAKALAGKKWVAMQPSATPEENQNTPAAAFGAVALESDPDLRKALVAVFDAGLVKADGAGHYSGTVAASALAASKLDDAHRAAIADAMKGASVTSEKLEVWLGADGLPTEIKYTDEVDAGKKPSHGEAHFGAWGKPVTVTVPAAADTIGFGALTQALKPAGS